MALKFLEEEQQSKRNAVAIGLVLMVCPLIRYMYIPIVFVIPAWIFFSGWINKNKRLRIGGITTALTLCLGVIGLLLFQKLYTGTATYVIPSHTGFFPENLTRMNPFIFSSFVNLMLACSYLEKFTHIAYLTWVDYSRYTNYIPFVILLSGFGVWMMKRRFKNLTLTQHYIYIGAFTSLVTIALLAMLSLRNEAITTNTYPRWTFVEEPRYYAFITTFIQHLFFLLLLMRWKTIRSKLLKLITVLGLLLLIIEALHGFYYNTRNLVKESNRYYSDAADHRLVTYTFSVVKEMKAKYPGKQIVITSLDPSFNNLGNMGGAIGLYDPLQVEKGTLRSTKDALVIVVIRDKDYPYYPKFLENSNKINLNQINDHHFFAIHVSAAK
jgi:hypothetical protein